MKVSLGLIVCLLFGVCELHAQVPNNKVIPFQQGEETLYYLFVSVSLPDTIYLQLSDSVNAHVSNATKKQWRDEITKLSREITCLLEKGVEPDSVKSLQKRKANYEKQLSKGIIEKMVGRDELVFTVLSQRMFKRISNQKLATDKVVFLYNQVKSFYDWYANEIDETSIPDSIQQKINDLKQKIAVVNDSIEIKSAKLRQLRIERSFRLFYPRIGKNERGRDRHSREIRDFQAKSNKTKDDSTRFDKARIKLNNLPKTDYAIANREKLQQEKLIFRVDRKKLVAHREGIAKKVRDYKSYYATPSLYLTGSALSYLEDKEPTTTTGIGIYSRKSDLWEFSMYMTISQSRDVVRANFDDREIFGNALLIPGIRKYSLLTSYRYFSIRPFSTSSFTQKLGFGWNVNLTPMTWEVTRRDDQIRKDANNNLLDEPIITSQVIPFSSDLFFSFNWLTSKSKSRAIGKEFRVSTDFGFTTRYLFGDLAQKAGWIEQFLDSPRRWYPGIYLGINVAIDNLQIYFNGPILMGAKVEGLTYGQTIANIGIRGKLFNISNTD